MSGCSIFPDKLCYTLTSCSSTLVLSSCEESIYNYQSKFTCSQVECCYPYGLGLSTFNTILYCVFCIIVLNRVHPLDLIKLVK